MYIIENRKIKYKLINKDALESISGFQFGSNRVHKIKGHEVAKLIIYNKKLAHPIVAKQVNKKYQKLIAELTDLLISDDDTGRSQMQALTEIERFRQIIKNKYREYLTRKDLEVMSKQLSLMQKTAKSKIIEIQNVLMNNEISKGRSSK